MSLGGGGGGGGGQCLCTHTFSLYHIMCLYSKYLTCALKFMAEFQEERTAEDLGYLIARQQHMYSETTEAGSSGGRGQEPMLECQRKVVGMLDMREARHLQERDRQQGRRVAGTQLFFSLGGGC